VGESLLFGKIYYLARKQNARKKTALNNMSEGLCMFDASTRLILCNERYTDMYGLPPELVQPGVLLRELLAHRIRAGDYAGDTDEYIAETVRRLNDGEILHNVRERPGGIFISVSSRPMAGGGWVATHTDITERFFFQAEDGIRDWSVTGVQTCALPI